MPPQHRFVSFAIWRLSTAVRSPYRFACGSDELGGDLRDDRIAVGAQASHSAGYPCSQRESVQGSQSQSAQCEPVTLGPCSPCARSDAGLSWSCRGEAVCPRCRPTPLANAMPPSTRLLTDRRRRSPYGLIPVSSVRSLPRPLPFAALAKPTGLSLPILSPIGVADCCSRRADYVAPSSCPVSANGKDRPFCVRCPCSPPRCSPSALASPPLDSATNQRRCLICGAPTPQAGSTAVPQA